MNTTSHFFKLKPHAKAAKAWNWLLSKTTPLLWRECSADTRFFPPCPLRTWRPWREAVSARFQLGAVILLFIFLSNRLSFGQTPLYENNFEKAEAGKVPEEFLVLDGQFTVKEESGNKLLELPGTPLDSFGVLFGPTEASDMLVSARISGTAKGRRAPTFGIGANGVGGYRLQVSPGKKMLELYKGDEVVQSIAYEWKSGAWTELRLQVRKIKDGEFKAEGKAWVKGSEEPKDWLVSHADTSPAAAGRASIWGSPYADTAIQFDDLSVSKITPK